MSARSLHSSSRSLVFYSHRYALTLQMDYSRARTDEDLVLGGEIVRRGGIPVPNIPVFLVSGHRVLAHCFSGPLGDFQLSCHLDGVPSLGLVVDADEWLEVNLGPTQRPSWAPDSRTTGGSGMASGAQALPGSTY